MTDHIHLYQGFTLVDITPTGQTAYTVDRELSRNQQRNWETVLQLLSLRTQPTIVNTTQLFADVKEHQFGIKYSGKHKIWVFTFGVEYPDIYLEGADKFGVLRNDFKIAPIIEKLTETVTFDKPMFYTSGVWNNIYFKTFV